MTCCDVLVIGGGPAGSTAAALLAQAGRQVVLLEKDTHPRFHIGESLLPQNLAIFETLGVLDEVRAIGVTKPGAEFVSDEHGRSVAFRFTEALARAYDHSFQVERAQLDRLLFANAARRGAQVFEGTRVVDATLGGPGRPSRIEAIGPNGVVRRWDARFVVDASGRDSFIARRQNAQSADKRNNTAAVFGHFTGVRPLHETEQGFIAVHLFDEGWFWAIPLQGGITSVGVVSHAGFFKRRQQDDLTAFLMRTVHERSPSLSRRMAGATAKMKAVATGNYSYATSHMVGEGYALVGDAYAFIDPVFSSGVMLAMQSASMAARATDVWLDDPRRAQPLFRAFEDKVTGSLRAFSWLIHRINDPTLRDLFMSPSNRFRMRDGVISILGGNAHGNRAAAIPILAFKIAFHVFSALRRWFGWRLRDGRLVSETELRRPAAGPVEAVG